MPKASAEAGRLIRVSGRVDWQLRDPRAVGQVGRPGVEGGERLAGAVVARGEIPNLVVDAGLDWLREFAFKSTTTKPRMGWIGVGSNGTAVAEGDDALYAEVLRKAFAYAAGGTGVAVLTVTFDAGEATGTIAEGGTFNDADEDEGEMWNRFLIGPLEKSALNALDVTVTVTFAPAEE